MLIIRDGAYSSDKKKERAAGFRKLAILVLAVFGFSCFVKVWQNVSIDQLNRKNSQLRAELRTLKNRNAILASNLDELKSMERITRLASEKLNLVQSPKVAIELSHKYSSEEIYAVISGQDKN
jgi:cell division protein FtsB